tara:strand:+ start:106 stop:708 length:603 start_codon:yes stop_codon:yes gene_type:complete
MKINATDRALLQEQAATVLKGFKPFRETVTRLVKDGATREELDSILDAGKIPAGSEPYLIISRILTNENNKKGKVGASGGGGGSQKQKAKTGKASKAAKKSVKKSVSLDVATIEATLAAVKANLISNFAESKIDVTTHKTATLADIEAIQAIVAKSVRQIGNKPSIVTDALPKAKAAVKVDKMPEPVKRNNAKPATASVS